MFGTDTNQPYSVLHCVIKATDLPLLFNNAPSVLISLEDHKWLQTLPFNVQIQHVYVFSPALVISNIIL